MALSVKPCSYQNGRARHRGPRVAWFRNNLIALSQYRNLLFIAYVDKIHVFEPKFPSQTLPTKPELILELPSSQSGVAGVIDATCPHAVNHLFIGDIGKEEILVASCDDGDVVSYTIRSIEVALEALKENIPNSDHKTPPVLSDRPWFLYNVGRSAWGLATHKAQRLLAVSANTEEIYIFAFSLGKLSSPEDEVKSDASLAHPKTTDEAFLAKDAAWDKVRKGSPRDRSKNIIIVLNLHHANIPNIAFYDSYYDGDETYLASTDIDGNTFVWEVWTGGAIINLQSSMRSNTRGWGVACLDPKASRLAERQIDAFGCKCLADALLTVDISEGAQKVPDNSHWHPAFAKLGSAGSNPSQVAVVLEQLDAELEAGSEDIDMDDANEIDVGDDELDEDVLEDWGTLDNEDLVPTDDFANSNHNGSGNDPEEHFLEDFLDPDLGSPMPTISNSAESSTPTQANAPLPTASELRREAWARRKNAVVGLPVETRERYKSEGPTLPFNVLQTSEADIHLFRNILREKRPYNQIQSQVVCQQAIQQTIPPGLGYLQRIERLNMVLQVPELSIVAVGNQAGRVGILTMTIWKHQKQAGFKVESIVPFKSQEELGLRPETPLLGIAIGPIQGHETKPDVGSALETPEVPATDSRVAVGFARRFRLIMLYCDHTVLTYEISRPAEGNELLVV